MHNVEAQTGLNFLSAIQPNVQTLIESQKEPGLW